MRGLIRCVRRHYKVTGETSSLRQVFEENMGQLRGVAWKIIGRPDQAEDIIQDAYIRLLKGKYTEKIDKPICYCRRMVRNIAIDYRRREQVEAAYRVYVDDSEALTNAKFAEAGADQCVHEQQMLEAIAEKLSMLPPRTRYVFELHRLSGLTQREIALKLDCSAATVNILVKEALNAISSCRQYFD